MVDNKKAASKRIAFNTVHHREPTPANSGSAIEGFVGPGHRLVGYVVVTNEAVTGAAGSVCSGFSNIFTIVESSCRFEGV